MGDEGMEEGRWRWDMKEWERRGVGDWRLRDERGGGDERMRDEMGDEGMGEERWRWELDGRGEVEMKYGR